jgi:hypothetical protein
VEAPRAQAEVRPARAVYPLVVLRPAPEVRSGPAVCRAAAEPVVRAVAALRLVTRTPLEPVVQAARPEQQARREAVVRLETGLRGLVAGPAAEAELAV